MNERIGSINNMITMLNYQIHTCINNLRGMLNKEIMDECHEFINYRRDRRHSKTLERQKKKFEWLWQKNTGGHSNTQSGWGGYHATGTEVTSPEENLEATPETTPEATTWDVTSEVTSGTHNKWVHNLSKTPLTEVQEKALAHGPNFVVVAREPPVSKYISQIERVCQQLKQGKAEELGRNQADFKEHTSPKPNIAKEEAKAIQELKKDQGIIILTVDKGVSMAVMDKDEYIKKSEDLLHQPTYKELTTDPTTKYKNRLISLLKTIKAEGGRDNTHLQEAISHRGRIPQVLWDAQNTQNRCTSQALNLQ